MDSHYYPLAEAACDDSRRACRRPADVRYLPSALPISTAVTARRPWNVQASISGPHLFEFSGAYSYIFVDPRILRRHRRG
jgi:hypothetical protein